MSASERVPWMAGKGREESKSTSEGGVAEWGPAAESSAPAKRKETMPSVATRHEALVAKLTRNGARRERHLWRQTQADVELSVILPAGTKAKMLKIELLPVDSEHPRQRFSVHWNGKGPGGASGVCFEEELAYPVEEPTGEDLAPGEKDDLMWELSDFETEAHERLLRVTLRKRAVHGVVIWWTRAIEGEEALDTTTLPDRKSGAKLAAQQTVWEEAMSLFKEKVANREKIVIEPSAEFLDEAAHLEQEEAGGSGAGGSGAGSSA